jgi:Cu/Zn superoxide dismutase
MRRITKAALGGLAGFALVLGATQFAAGASEATFAFARRLIDVQAANSTVDNPFDRAKAELRITETGTGSSTFRIHISRIDTSEEATTTHSFGAHLHSGLCVKGDMGGMLAGPHYKHDPKGLVDQQNEVWFDLWPNEDGTATYETSVPFTVDPGPAKELSVVIHERATTESGDGVGTAGARWACLPVDYEDLQ